MGFGTRYLTYLLYKAEPIEHIIRLIKNATEDKLYLLLQQISNFEIEKDNEKIEKQKLYEASGNRWITITIDSKEMLHGTIRNQFLAESIVTKNTGMVFFAQEYIKHDAYSLRMIDEFGEEKLKEVFGNNMEGLRDIFKMK